mgnify:CR=1 FL=1
MSLLYTRTRLWWNGWRGQAQCDGVDKDLTEPPVIEGVPIVEIDYAPELKCFQIRRTKHSSREEELERHEIVAIKRWLHRFAADIKRELGM